MFKIGGYNLKGLKVLTSNRIVFIDSYRFIAGLTDKRIKQQGHQKYDQSSSRPMRKVGSDIVILGETYGQVMDSGSIEFCEDWVQGINEIRPNKLPFFRRI